MKSATHILLLKIFNLYSILSKAETTICFLFFISCTIITEAKAQVLEPTGNSHHSVVLNIGFDNNVISLNLGYTYYEAKYKTSAFIDFTQGSSLIGTGDFRTQIGIQTWQGSFEKFNLKNSIAFVYAQSINKAGTYNGLGINIVSNPGFRFNRIGVGADFQYNPFFATHIKHSDYYREYLYENVKDGWYSSTAHNLRLGMYVAAQLGKKKTLELNIKGGYQNNGQYDKFVPNVYAIIGVNKSF